MCQQNTAKATIKHLKAANAVVTKAKKYAAGCGLYFPPLKLPLKEATVADSSHATRESSYAQEGVMVLLGHDGRMEVVSSESPHYFHVFNAESDMSDYFHVLAVISHKAKRVSSSTSTAETLAATVGKEVSQLVAIRLTEVLARGIEIPMKCVNPLSVLIRI